MLVTDNDYPRFYGSVDLEYVVMGPDKAPQYVPLGAQLVRRSYCYDTEQDLIEEVPRLECCPPRHRTQLVEYFELQGYYDACN